MSDVTPVGVVEDEKTEIEYLNPPDPEVDKGKSTIDFYPHGGLVVVYAPPVEQKSDAGIDLSQADSLRAKLPKRGTVVAHGPWSHYSLGDEVLVRRYTGIQLEVDGDDDYWLYNEYNGEILGRFDTSPPADD